MRRIHIIIILFVATVLSAVAQRIETVMAEYIYRAPDNETVQQAKEEALRRAKSQAIADKFGTYITDDSKIDVVTINGETSSVYTASGASSVRGEWVATLSEPVYDIAYADNMLVVKVSVKGKIREYNFQKVNVDAHLLRNGTDSTNMSTDFVEGDVMYLRFNASCPGHLLVYQTDDRSAFRLLPYRRQTEGSVRYDEARPVVYFDKNAVPPDQRRLMDEYIMLTTKPVEINTVWVIFSPNNLFRAADSQIESALPCELNRIEFQKWVNRARMEDKQLVVKEIPVTIRKK